MIKAVIFDMDGVIINSEPVYLRVEQSLFNELGLELTPEEHATYVGRSDLWESVKQKYGLDININQMHVAEQERYLNEITNNFEEGPIDGVAELIKKLHGKQVSLALASSSPMDNIHLVLRKFALLDYFPCKISGADLETSKPHPEIFLKAAECIGTNPEKCLVIEDSMNGVRAAKAAGMKCIGYQNTGSGNQDLSAANWIISGFEEFELNKYGL